MKRIGLTGGIGSGKTTVAKIFETLGIPVYYADDRGKYLLARDLELRENVISSFGPDILTDEHIDRKKLGAIVFADSAKLSLLNSLVHPAVGRDYKAWCESEIDSAPYSLKEAAILFETGGHREMDEVILVTAPEELRIQRVMDRDGVEASSVKARMAHQWNQDDKISLADYIIENDGEHSLIEQVLALHDSLRLT